MTAASAASAVGADAGTAGERMLRRIGIRDFDFSRQVAVMAVINRTPDSFYDKGATFALDQAYHLSSATVTLDNNDVYRFYASTDGVSFTTLFTASGLFDQPAGANVSAGQVTMPVSFAETATAYRYVRVQALLGDGAYSVGEVSFGGVAAVVPEPSSLALLLGGVGLVGFVARRRQHRG